MPSFLPGLTLDLRPLVASPHLLVVLAFSPSVCDPLAIWNLLVGYDDGAHGRIQGVIKPSIWGLRTGLGGLLR
jgi:hypothetical protein